MKEEESARVENLRPLRFNAIWLVPLLALIVAGWMVYDNWAEMGEKIVLVADNAEGIESGKTKVKVHNVDVGEVTDVSLSEDFKQALITVQMKKGTDKMLRSDSKFWVVKPRVGIKGVSGLGTMFSGAYIEMEPGRSGKMSTQFKMMPQPPLSTTEDKGIRLRLKSKDLAKMDIGTPVHFRGYEVGHIEKVDFDVKTGEINYRLFIQAPYDSLVNDAVQFWLTPGFSLKGSARGLEVRVDSLENLFLGGITFGLTREHKPGRPVSDLSKFRLYPSKEEAINNQFRRSIDYVFLFEGDTGGLQEGAPVEFGGVRVGTVKEVPFSGSEANATLMFQTKKVPVLAGIEPQRLETGNGTSLSGYWTDYFQDCIDRGLRGSLKTTSLLTGARVIDLHFVPDPGPWEQKKWQGHPVFPVSSGSGLEGVEKGLNALLKKLNTLPLEGTLAGLNSTFVAADEVFAELGDLSHSLKSLSDNASKRRLPEKLEAAVEQFNSTLAGYDQGSRFGQQLERDLQALERLLLELKPLVRELRERPSALIFDRRHQPDKIPPKAEREKE
ncbi:MAG: intermembrane transport protein PqiB [Desulfonatronovibrionaceae bacterium]